MWVTNGRAAAPPCSSLQHRRLDLDEAAAGGTTRAATRTTAARSRTHVAGLRPHDQVDVALPDPGLLGQRACARPAAAAAPWPRSPTSSASTDSSPRRRGDHLAGDERRGRRGRRQAFQRASDSSPTRSRRQHHLQLGAVALAQRREAELAGVAEEDHPAGDRRPCRRWRCPAARSGCAARTSRQRVGARRPRPGTARRPPASSRPRFSRRTRICSGRSSWRGRDGGGSGLIQRGGAVACGLPSGSLAMPRVLLETSGLDGQDPRRPVELAIRLPFERPAAARSGSGRARGGDRSALSDDERGQAAGRDDRDRAAAELGE